MGVEEHRHGRIPCKDITAVVSVPSHIVITDIDGLELVQEYRKILAGTVVVEHPQHDAPLVIPNALSSCPIFVFKKRILRSQPIVETGNLLPTVGYLVANPVAVVVDVRHVRSVNLVLPSRAGVVRETPLLHLHFRQGHHLPGFGQDIHRAVPFQYRIEGYVGFHGWEIGHLGGGETAKRRAEMAVNGHVIALGLVPATRLEHHVPFPIYVGQAEGVMPRAVRHRAPRQAETLPVVQVSRQFHSAHRAAPPLPVKTAEQVQAVLHRLFHTERRTATHHLPVVTPPPLDQHQQVCRKAVLQIVRLEVVFRTGNITAHF